MKKLTNFFNCAAKAASKTGGGNSQTRGHQLGVASVITSTLSRFDSLSIVSRESDLRTYGAISALLSSRVYRYVACLLLAFVLGIGNVWGDAASWKNNTMSPASYFTLGSNTSAASNSKTIESVSYTHSINMTSKSNQSSNNTNGYFIQFTLSTSSNVSILFGANGGGRTIRLNTGWSYDASTNSTQLNNGATPSDGIIETSSSVSNGSYGTLSKSNVAAGTYYICGSGSVSIYSITITNAGGGCTAPNITTNLTTTEVEYEQNAAASALGIEATGTSVTYQWYSNTANSATTPAPTALANCTTETYTPSTSTLGTIYYFCVASSSTCTTTSNIKPVTVVEASGGDPGPVAVTGITITPASPEVTVGNTVALTATITPDNATDKTVTWSVQSGGTYASVNSSGVVTGLAEGSATIRATANDGSGVYTDKEVTVNPAPTCPDAGIIFKFETKASISGSTSITDNPVSITTSNYLQTLTTAGGSLTAYNNNSNFQIASNGMKLADKSKAYLILNLGSCSLKAGDIVKTKVTSQNAVLSTSTSADNKFLDITKNDNVQTYTLAADVDASTIYLLGTSNGAIVYSVEINRPATITLDATTNGGTAVDPIVGLVEDKVVLPHAFKSGKRFKGWYTDASAGTKQADYYTISTSTTLYAQFEDIPASGTIFSLALEDGLKPAANCTIKNATGFVQTQDMIRYATVSGGSAILSNSSTSNHAIITTTPTLKFAGSSACLLITFESALREGDVITTAISGSDLSYTTNSTRSTSNIFTKGSNKTLTITDKHVLEGATAIYLWAGSSSGGELTSLSVSRPVSYTATLSPAEGSTSAEGWTLSDGVYTKSGILGTASVVLPTMTRSGYKFVKWTANQDVTISEETVEAGEDIAAGASVKLSANTTFTAQWTPTYAVTYSAGDGSGEMTDSNSPYVASAEVTLMANAFTAPSGKEFDAWVVTETVSGDAVSVTNGKFTMPAAAVTVTATWKDKVVKYVITKGTHANGDFTIDLAEQEEGETVTLSATPDEDYVFSAWAVVKTEDGSATGITVSNNTFTMPAYGVTVNATFAADPRQKVLYVTANSADATKSNDKVYAALKDTYNVKIVGPSSDVDQSGYALVVLHESLNGGNDYNNTAVAAAKIGNVPVLNTKAYFYNSGRWAWGTPNAGRKTKGVHVNRTYCNITNHPLFNDLTPDANDSIIILSSISGDNKPIQPIGSFTSGKEGYTLANVPDGCAIHELTPAQRGAVSGKYLLISLYTKDFANLNANGQKLFQNAAAYLIGNTAWEPVNALSSPAVTASPSAAYSVGDNIALTASATGVSAATTYTWYKGATWAAAEEAGAIQAAATAASNGNKYGVTGCALGDAGTYWCVISNGTGCEVSASLAITVSDISYDIAFVSAHGTAPTATTGVSYTLPELSADGWEHQGWTANINVEVDAETVTAGTTIANGKIATFGADVEFTAVWAEVFDVTFNMQSHGASIAAQHIVDGGKATEPNDPSAIGWDFGGWFTDAECTEGNEFDFNTAITAATPLYAKWTAFTGCVELWPATSGDAPAVGDEINMQSGSNGATMTVMAVESGTFAYTSAGLQFGSNAGPKVSVVLNNEMSASEGTKISITLVAGGTNTRGLNLYDANGNKIDAFTCWVKDVNPATNGAEETFTYTVVENDGLDGANEFQLARNNTVCLKSLKVESCGDAIIYHDLTSAISPDHDPAYATVTLGASSVREGRTTTAEYSAINAAYEFDEWQISGTGASIADASANPAVITMGTADAVVTLKLKAATPKHTVTFNKMGKGDDIASQSVKEGDLIEEPTVTEPEGWILEGWYTENTFDNEWDFASDVMSTSDIELFANWVADTSIKLINKSTGAINTTNFTTAVAAEADVDGEKGAVFNANRDAITSVSALNEMVQYNATTNQTKIQLSMYNTSSNEKTIHLFKVAEGDDAATVIDITIDGNSRLTTEYYTFNSDKNRSFYVTVSDKKVQILQMRVVEDGTAIKQFGQAGYSFNMNKGRIFAKSGNAVNFEGASVTTNSDYKVLNNSSLSTNSYIRFTTTVDGMILKVTRSGGNYYVSQDPENKGTSYSKNEEVVLATAGTWYIGSTSSGSSASFTKFEFIAPKCETPAFNALANSDICSGDAYVALDGTGTVSDGGSITYKWYAEGDAETVLATTATYTPVADGNYYVVALHHVDGYTDNEATSDVVTVTTHAGTAITEALADQRGNVDAVVALEVAASGKNLHYEWKESATIDGTYTAVAGAADAASLNVTITEGMNKYYKVVVSSDCGANQESVAHVTQYVPVAQANVTGSIAWNWANAASVNEIKLTTSTSPKKNEGFVMANGAATIYNNANFESDKLYLEGEYITRYEGGNHLFQGQTIKFNTTVPGVVRVKFSHTGNNKPARELYINGVGTGDSRTSATAAWSRYVEVPAGEVSITAYHVDPADGAGQQYIRVPEIEFLQLIESRSGYAANTLGTACYEDDAVVTGATVYELQGANENGYMVFDEITSGEIEAGKPYLFEATGTGNVGFYRKANATHADEAGSIKGMYGTFAAHNLQPGVGDYYYFSGRHIWEVNAFNVAYITIPAHRCYVDYTEFLNNPVEQQAPAPGRRRVMLGVNGTNGATGLENAEALDGRVQKVLIDGKIYILRGEKIFDATGRLVK